MVGCAADAVRSARAEEHDRGRNFVLLHPPVFPTHGHSAGRRLVSYSNELQPGLPFESEVNIADAQWQQCRRYPKC
jgi:hypothetical protein